MSRQYNIGKVIYKSFKLKISANFCNIKTVSLLLVLVPTHNNKEIK